MHRRILQTSWFVLSIAIVTMLSTTSINAHAQPPIALHPENPHYFLWRDKPTVLITAGEHYGALINNSFDYVPYLAELRRHGLNLTRTFSGTYLEIPDSFGITDNPLSPNATHYIAPWATTDAPGRKDGGNKFDLTKWNEKYFERLRAFVAEASRAGVVVEFTLFCTIYDDNLWGVSPMNAANNVNGIGTCPRQEVLRLAHDDLTQVQFAFARKIANELRDADNVIYEICNEPYIEECVSKEWQHAIVDVIVEEEKKLGVQHLITMNIANRHAKIENPHPEVDVFNFHYAAPPVTVPMNFHLNKVIGDNETGFAGRDDVIYRVEAWDFMLAGGALFNHLDWSFTPGHPSGDLVDYSSPGGGSLALRQQLATLKKFFEGFEFVKMAPNPALVTNLPEGISAQVLAEPGKQYAVYLHTPMPPKPDSSNVQVTFNIELPAGSYLLAWLNPLTGTMSEPTELIHPGGACSLTTHEFKHDIALAIRTQKSN